MDDDPIIENAFIKFKNGVNGLITSASGMNTRISCSQGTLTVGADGSWIEIEKEDIPKPDTHKPYHASAYLRMVQGPNDLWYEQSHE